MAHSLLTALPGVVCHLCHVTEQLSYRRNLGVQEAALPRDTLALGEKRLGNTDSSRFGSFRFSCGCGMRRVPECALSACSLRAWRKAFFVAAIDLLHQLAEKGNHLLTKQLVTLSAAPVVRLMKRATCVPLPAHPLVVHGVL